jgi:hypothetical protein
LSPAASLLEGVGRFPPNRSISEHMRLIADNRMGRVQRQVKRALIALGSARIQDLLEWAYPQLTSYLPWHRTNVHRAASKVAEVRRSPGRAAEVEAEDYEQQAHSCLTHVWPT